MKVELVIEELEQMQVIAGGVPPSEAYRQLIIAFKRGLMLSGWTGQVPKTDLVWGYVLSCGADRVMGPIDVAPEKLDRVVEPELEVTPIDELAADEVEQIEAEYNGFSDGHKDSYEGVRVKWPEVKFKSTPRSPVTRWEKGRPITYLSTKLHSRLSGRFVRINQRNKREVIIVSSEQKKPFSVSASACEPTDLSPPSREPLPVQI